ncbi:MAG TPA: hypothetical protein PKH44_05065 [Plasticicumulans sp.]|nr:hypothetical protein [Plasticicumulans sp.]
MIREPGEHLPQPRFDRGPAARVDEPREGRPGLVLQQRGHEQRAFGGRQR